MKRLDAYYTNDFGDRLSAFMEESSDGAFVEFSDVEQVAQAFEQLSAKCDCTGVYCDWCALVRSAFKGMQ